MISVEALKVEFGVKPLFHDVSFVINERDRIALVGKNGAGKTTLLKILCGMQKPTSGHVAVPHDTSTGATLPLTPRYDGSVSAMSWHTSSMGQGAGYQFDYDGLGRLTEAGWTGSSSQDHSVFYTYDTMGNMTEIMRQGRLGDNSYGYMDDLQLEYDGNHLVKADNLTSNYGAAGDFSFTDGLSASVEYLYDANGNMTADLNKGVSLTYNRLNLPLQAAFPYRRSTAWVHGADGTKLRVTHSTGMLQSAGVPSVILLQPIVTTTDYCGNLLFENGELLRLLVDGGYVTFTNGTPHYHFHLRDHLGSSRVVFSETGAVEQETQYYPYGGIMADLSTGQDAQRHKYNGKELDRMHGIDWYDYGARHYDAVLGRWTTMDPLCEKYYNVSPYAYCGNNPVRYVDLDGRKIVLKGSQEERMTMLNFLQRLTNDNLFLNRNTGVVTIGGERWDNRDKKLDVGTSLLREVIGHDRTTEIRIGAKNDINRYHSYFPLDKSNGKGTDGYINLNPSLSVGLRVQDSNTGNTIIEIVPMEITVGHELIHAYSGMNGVIPNENQKSTYIYKDVDGKMYETSVSTSELETIGIKGNNKYTENKLRKEHGLNKRVAY